MAFQALEADYVSNLPWFEEKFEGLVHVAHTSARCTESSHVRRR